MTIKAKTAGSAVVYCIVPPDLADKLHEPLRQHFAEHPRVQVVVERRDVDRRVGPERRTAAKPLLAADRRVIRALAGRRIVDRRAAEAIVAAPENLPRAAAALAHRLVFVERLEPTGQELEDADTARLVTRFQAGDRDAFSKLYLRFFDNVYNYLRVLLNDPHEAEDATQQVFVQVLNALPRYERRKQPFRVWLFVVVRNAGFDRLRQKRRLDVADPLEIARRRDGVECDDGDASLSLDWITDRELLLFIERLPLPQRQVLMLRFMMDLSAAEVARVLDLTPENVRIMQHRALAYLRQRLAGVGRGPAQGKSLRMRRGIPKSTVLRSRRFALLS